jgi:uncharacterized membrane protein
MVMKLHSLPRAVNPAWTRPIHGIDYPDGRGVSVVRLAAWLANGMAIARMQPLLWLAAILACADLASLLELAPPLRLLAVLVVPVLAGALSLMQERASNARPWTLAETFAVVGGHGNALVAVGLAGAAIAWIGYLIPLAVLHTTVTTSSIANGAHSLSIVYGAHNGPASPLEPLVSLPLYAVALATVWFAPALVVLRNLKAAEAMTASLRAVLRNWPVALVYVAAIAGDVLLAPVVPFIVRGLVVTPLVTALIVLSMYGCYRDVFGAR